jgi:RluA family pseudouridine synthase
VHRHELPVLDLDFPIIYQNDDVLVIDKPPGIPIHPCGRYNKNSVTHILKHEYGIDPLFVIHRLDALTSGVVMFGKSSRIAQEISKEMQNKEILKLYIAKVQGKFPDGIMTVDKKISVLDFKKGTRKIDDQAKEGKESVTKFYLIHYDQESDSSIVFARPITGRTHQIRLHVASLGHPITNDPIYGKKREELESKGLTFDDHDNIIENPIEENPSKRKKRNIEDMDELCEECKKEPPNIDKDDLILYLHAWRYKTSKYDLFSSIPSWCPHDLTKFHLDFMAELDKK